MRRRSISLDNLKDVDVFENDLCRFKMLKAFEETHAVLIMLRKEKQHRIQLTQELDHLTGTIHAQNDEKIVHTELGAALTRAQKYITHLTKSIRYFQEKTGEYGHVIETEDGNKTWESYLSMASSASTTDFTRSATDFTRSATDSTPSMVLVMQSTSPVQSSTPPVQSSTPPTQSFTPPTQSFTPPVQLFTPPAQSSTPPEQLMPMVFVVPAHMVGMNQIASSSCNSTNGAQFGVSNEMVMYILKQTEDKHQQDIQYIQTQHYWEMQNVNAYYSTLLHEWHNSFTPAK